MAKKSSNARKLRGAAGIATIGDEPDPGAEDVAHEDNGIQPVSEAIDAKPKRAKTQQQSIGHFGVNDIKKAAAFANSVGGLDKAIAVLQILKVAKEVH